VGYIALELAQHGDLINIITKFGKLPESIARLYFGQLVEVLEFIHMKGYSHLDIKPDNILFDKNYNLKLWDFGFASESKYLSSKYGTLNYAAPEIFTQEQYNAPVTDIFSAGIILFIMVTGHPPFCKPDVSDIRYKHILNNNLDQFWELIDKKNTSSAAPYSEEFKELVTMMMSPNPLVRPSLAEVKSHAWFTGKLYEEEQTMASDTNMAGWKTNPRDVAPMTLTKAEARSYFLELSFDA